jgi:hypothetical protein
MTIRPPAAMCTLTEEGAFTIVKVKHRCTVCYEFDTSASNADLALRYVVVVDGNALPTRDGKPSALNGKNRTISVAALPGSKVALFLNSDVHPDYQRHPVYAVQVGDNDVLVTITERAGRISHESSKLRPPRQQLDAKSGKPVDMYSAALTGDIWMEISTVYTAAEADAMLPADTDPDIRGLVRQIYEGLPSKQLQVTFPAADGAPRRAMAVRFDESDNVLGNVTHCALLTGVLPRTHPCAYAALLTEARAAGVTSLRVTSGWRPMLGSIAHRAGLGLDIDYVESDSDHVAINRAALTKVALKRNDNVSELEQNLYADYMHAKWVAEESDKERTAAQNILAHNRDSGAKDLLQRRLTAAEETAKKAKSAKDLAEGDWSHERDRHEPSLIRTLRAKLSYNKSINQILDPWYIDTNTNDDIPAVPNEQRSQNEKTHNNHLHITVSDPKIL